MNDYIYNCDVAVLGGGIAGTAAAIQAARSGAKTVLLEKNSILGGLATSGLIYVYLPLCDGYGCQTTFGLAEEILKTSTKYGPGDIPDWEKNRGNSARQRYYTCFSPASLSLALDELCDNAGVDIWFDTWVCKGNIDEAGVLRSVAVENKSGRGIINAKIFIDATGDAHVARRLEDHECGYNYMSSWVLEHDKHVKCDEPYIMADNLGRYILSEPQYNKDNPEIVGTFHNIDGAANSSFLLESRRKIRKRYLKAYADGSRDRHGFFPLALPSMASFRKTFAIKGKTILESGQQESFFRDSIGLLSDWRRSGPVWEIPYGSLVPAKTKALLLAGRCISSFGDAWEVTRVIPSVAMTGQVVGLAAGIALDTERQPDDIDIELLQNKLCKMGFILHCSELKRNRRV
jgi:hypothetical protein